MDGTIGIVLATYNGSKYVDSQLRSILNQTKQPDMIVVSDANSSDDTVRICMAILEKSNICFKIIENKKRLSAAENFEIGFYECDTDYIFFCDQDDVWCEDKIEIFYNNMKNTKAIMAFSDAYIVNEELKYDGIRLWNSINYSPLSKDGEYSVYKKQQENLLNILLKQNIVTGMSMCVRKEIKDYCLPFPNGVLHDAWLALVSIVVGDVLEINKPLVNYRQHNNNTVGTEKSLSKSIRNGKYYLERLECRKAMLTKLRTTIINEYGEDYALVELVDSYIHHLGGRIDYIMRCKKSGRPQICSYKAYEYNYRKIVLRDILCKYLWRNRTDE